MEDNRNTIITIHVHQHNANPAEPADVRIEGLDDDTTATVRAADLPAYIMARLKDTIPRRIAKRTRVSFDDVLGVRDGN